jgi:hypothetical protein
MYFVVAMRVAEMGGWPVGWVPYLRKIPYKHILGLSGKFLVSALITRSDSYRNKLRVCGQRA